ncbi:PIN domain nuclease [Leptolyngbya sp. 15MV]|nr:PIN domain nuclease [Leptolyngbya sp. 15MV]
MIVADTSVWVDFLRGRANPETMFLHGALRIRPVIVGDLILCEVLQGVPDDRQAERVEALLRRSPIVAMGHDAVAVAAARNYRSLRARGITIRKTIDLLIGTFCMREGLPLLHRDRDYDPMEQHLGLRVIHP